MSKRELIDRIRLFNPTAASTFLAQFGEGDLTQYLQHLVDTTPPTRLANLRNAIGSMPSLEEAVADPRQLALTF
jgi:flagellar biosynthesis/type III secretory pathway chaperone